MSAAITRTSRSFLYAQAPAISRGRKLIEVLWSGAPPTRPLLLSLEEHALHTEAVRIEDFCTSPVLNPLRG